jgi:hypothetical protein
MIKFFNLLNTEYCTCKKAILVGGTPELTKSGGNNDDILLNGHFQMASERQGETNAVPGGLKYRLPNNLNKQRLSFYYDVF